MRRPHLHLLLALFLLLQGMGSVWAATRMASQLPSSVAASAVGQPPCHAHAAKVASKPAVKHRCCCSGASQCHCAAVGSASSAAMGPVLPMSFPPQGIEMRHLPQSQPTRGFSRAPARPPAL